MSAPVPAPDPLRILALLRRDDIDAAIDAGLMQLDAAAAAVEDARELQQAQARLHAAWDARERHRQRAERLAARALDRAARSRGTTADAAALPGAPSAAPAIPGLPPAAAAALARARARAAGTS